MYGTPKVQVGMSALSLALKARTHQCDDMDVEETHTLATQLLDDDDPMFRAVSSFATQYQIYATDRVMLAQIGEDLMHAVELAAQPDPVDIGRMDIHG